MHMPTTASFPFNDLNYSTLPVTLNKKKILLKLK